MRTWIRSSRTLADPSHELRGWAAQDVSRLRSDHHAVGLGVERRRLAQGVPHLDDRADREILVRDGRWADLIRPHQLERAATQGSEFIALHAWANGTQIQSARQLVASRDLARKVAEGAIGRLGRASCILEPIGIV